VQGQPRVQSPSSSQQQLMPMPEPGKQSSQYMGALVGGSLGGPLHLPSPSEVKLHSCQLHAEQLQGRHPLPVALMLCYSKARMRTTPSQAHGKHTIGG
jgi:hypothetical protein